MYHFLDNVSVRLMLHFACAAGHGERTGDIMRTGLWCWGAKDAGNLFAEVLDYSSIHSCSRMRSLCVCCTHPEALGAERRDSGLGREVLHMDDPGIVCLRSEFPHSEVPSSSE